MAYLQTASYPPEILQITPKTWKEGLEACRLQTKKSEAHLDLYDMVDDLRQLYPPTEGLLVS